MMGSPGGQATFEILGATRPEPMREVSSGRYEVEYRVPRGLNVEDGIVMVTLTDHGRSTSKEADRLLTIASGRSTPPPPPAAPPPPRRPRAVKWDLDKDLDIPTQDTGRVNAVAFSPDGRLIATGGWNNVLKLWDARNGDEKRVIPLQGKGDLILDVAFSPDGTLVATGNRDYETRRHTINIFDVRSGRPALSLRNRPPNFGDAVAFSPDSNLVAVGCWDGKKGVATTKVWDTHSGRVRWTFSESFGPVAFSPNNNTLAAGAGNLGSLKLFDLRSGRQSSSIPVYSAKAVDFSPDGRRLVTGDGKGKVKVWDARTGDELMSLDAHQKAKHGIEDVKYSPDGNFIVSAGDDGSIYVWDTTTGRHVTRKHAAEPYKSVDFSPDSRRIVTCNESDYRVTVWRLTRQ